MPFKVQRQQSFLHHILHVTVTDAELMATLCDSGAHASPQHFQEPAISGLVTVDVLPHPGGALHFALQTIPRFRKDQYARMVGFVT